MTLEGKLSLQSRSTRRNAYDFAAAQTTCWNCICCTHNLMSTSRADSSSSWNIHIERSIANWSFFLRTHLDSCVEEQCIWWILRRWSVVFQELMMPSSWETLKESSFNWEICILVETSLEHPYKYSILLNKEISGGMTAVRRQSSSLLQKKKKKKKKIDNQFQHMIIDRPARHASWTRGRQVHPCLLVPVPPDSQRVAKLPDHVQAKDLLHKRCGGQGRLEWNIWVQSCNTQSSLWASKDKRERNVDDAFTL